MFIPNPLTVTSNNIENSSGSPPEEKAAELPVWLQRSFLVIYVLVCIELGILLVVIPWTAMWSNNSLFARWPELRYLLQHSFVKGAISGLGLVDIWLGVMEAMRYRDRR